MSNGIKLSPKYGVNPTIPVCFWCGKERNEVALMGHIGDVRRHKDFEAPMRMVIDYNPCEECQKNMALGLTVMEATTAPNDVASVEFQTGVYPTGRFVVVKRESARKIFKGLNAKTDKVFLDKEAFSTMFCNAR